MGYGCSTSLKMKTKSLWTEKFGSLLSRPILTMKPLLLEELEPIRRFQKIIITEMTYANWWYFNLHSPKSMSSRTWSGEATISSLKPATNIPRFMPDFQIGWKPNYHESSCATMKQWCETKNNPIPLYFHGFAISGAQGPTNHLSPHYRFPYMTSVEETLYLFPTISGD